eukprot:TRINITY_DN44167_c0_g1_i1.p1 TRINITY_DN44167_c0_g1~~TRINITY_DN44167_c0_g1_i1.p1  ORF type:complete len:624 (-),score=142.37 TRINITY_DN44167_c0_g1_i1:63-1934(-)
MTRTEETVRMPNVEEQGAPKRGRAASYEIGMLKDQLKKAYCTLESLKDKDALFLVGDTGVGKSTVANYLLGCEMKRVVNKFVPVVDCENPKSPIGHQMHSCTEVPMSYECSTELCLVDCPGFGDTRGSLQKATCDLGVYLALRMAHGVRGVAVVIDYNSFVTQRGACTRGVLDTISSLLLLDTAAKEGAAAEAEEGTQEIESPLMFLMTKTPDGVDPRSFPEWLDAAIAHERDNQQDTNVVQILQWMKQTENVFFVDVFDSDRIAEILQQAGRLRTMRKDSFHLFQGTHTKLRGVIDLIARNTIPLMSMAVALMQSTTQLVEEISGLDRTITELATQENEGAMAAESALDIAQRLLSGLSAELQGMKADLDAARKHLNNCQSDLIKCNDEGKEVVIGELLRFRKSQILFLPEHTFTYDGIPFQYVVTNSYGQDVDEFDVTVHDPKNGRFTAIYKVKKRSLVVLPHHGHADVTIWVQRADTDSWKREATQRQENCAFLEQELDQKEQRYKDKQTRVATSRDQLESVEQDKDAKKRALEAVKSERLQKEARKKECQEQLGRQQAEQEKVRVDLNAHREDLEFCGNIAEYCPNDDDAKWENPQPRMRTLWEQCFPELHVGEGGTHC